MNVSNKLCDAITAACMAHLAQLDKGGKPYAHHVLRVGLQFLPDEETAIVGVLHDFIEDYPSKPVPQKEVLKDILENFGQTIATAVRLLTRDETTPYAEYIAQLAPNDLARKVKLADLHDNLDPIRLAAAKQKGYDVAPLIERYQLAIGYLRDYELDQAARAAVAQK